MFRYLLPSTLFAFICWIIYQADTEQSNYLINLSGQIPYGDKIGHFCLFGSLALLLNISLSFKKTQILFLQFHWGSVVIFIFALAEEVSQGFFKSRNQDFNDVIADLIGIFLFTFIGKKILAKKERA